MNSYSRDSWGPCPVSLLLFFVCFAFCYFEAGFSSYPWLSWNSVNQADPELYLPLPPGVPGLKAYATTTQPVKFFEIGSHSAA